MDSEPYEVVIRQLNQIVAYVLSLHCTPRKNISHCFWAMDVLKAMSKNASFSITKSLFSKDTFESRAFVPPFRVRSLHDEGPDCGKWQGVRELFGGGVLSVFE